VLAPSLQALLASIRDGILAWNAQPDVAMQVIGQYASIAETDILQRTYDFYTNTAPFEPSLQPTLVAGVKAMMDFLASSGPKVVGYGPEQFVDSAFVASCRTEPARLASFCPTRWCSAWCGS
jgi:hypothetical protein